MLKTGILNPQLNSLLSRRAFRIAYSMHGK